jgi:hypothetical protein
MIWQWFGESAHRRLLAVSAQLALVLFVIHLYSIEKDFGLVALTPIIFGGFMAHALLPRKARMPFFLLLSLFAVAVVLGFSSALVVVGIGLVLIAICHLPVAFSVRVGLLAAAGVLLAMVRGEWIVGEWTPILRLALPVLGAMFMFRLIVYMYDLRHEKQPASIWERLSYFFMLPNVCFLLFPVVDYRTFRRTYYNAESNGIYQKGVTWILRGVVHLLLYRIVYYAVLPSAAEVADLASLLQYMAGTYLLYLRISGQFHLIIGIMCLFGFNLPETHNLYYLASSFNDYWRRINIYWKDFMMKIFYYPSLNRLRRRGLVFGIVVSTLVVFAGTWLLHSYQWFWLQGSFPLTAPDAAFWGILGIMVVFNSVYEATRGRKVKLGAKRFTWAVAWRHSLKVVGMLLVITLLWTLWSSHTLAEFAALMAVGLGAGVVEWMLFAAGVASLVAVGAFVQYLGSRGMTFSMAGGEVPFRRAALSTTLGVAALVVIAMSQLHPSGGTMTASALAALHSQGLNEQDEQQQLLGYYEGLLDSRRIMSARWDVRGRSEPPADWGDLNASIVTRSTNDILQYELRPNTADTVFRAPFQVNRWGMRDRDYERKKPSATFRIAMLGASYVVGAGVEQHETFEALIEERLNRDLTGGQLDRIEVLNFAVGGYDPFRTLIDYERRIRAFQPDLVCYVVHTNDGWRMRQNLVSAVSDGLEVDDLHVRFVLRTSGVDASMSRTEIDRRLTPYTQELLDRAYGRLAKTVRESDATVVAFVLPRVIDADASGSRENHRITKEKLAAAGFRAFSLIDVYGDLPPAALWLGPWDEHPNATGHRLIASEIVRLLKESGEIPMAHLAPR